MNSEDTAVTQERRDELAEAYFDSLPFDPYPVQQEALLAWFTNQQGVLVCAPTGTGKTLIAEAAMFEALHLGKTAYYTTPLIALTDQKYRELQQAAIKWGFSADDVGLVTGNRKVNPHAKILVVVAEILLNRLLNKEAFDFQDVWAVVMDEFHSFNDRERGIVWEFGLGLLPKQVKTLLLSATVGNSMEFTGWLRTRHDRDLQLVQGDQRKVPLQFEWVDDQLLSEQIELMVNDDPDLRRTPALVFCFNREQCWSVAEQLKGKRVVSDEQQKKISQFLSNQDMSPGAGPKLKRILMRGIGVHHAGVLPRYRRIVEELFQQKLLSLCVCTETLAAGINLPARSVVLPTLLKGPFGKMKVIEPSSAHQMFGRAGRPQFDDRGFVYSLAHEDDVKIMRAQEKLDQIPESTKDPGLLKQRKRLKKKLPKRREGVQYWNETQFQQLVAAPPADLASRGGLPWRMLAYMLQIAPEVEPIRQLVAKRLLKGKESELAQKQLNEQLITLWRAGYVDLEPKPSLNEINGETRNENPGSDTTPQPDTEQQTEIVENSPPTLQLDMGQRRKPVGKSDSSGRNKATIEAQTGQGTAGLTAAARRALQDKLAGKPDEQADKQSEIYKPRLATPTDRLADLAKLRGVNPLYGIFLVNHLGIANRAERLQAMESLLEMPRSMGRSVRVPSLEELPAGPLATGRLDAQLLKLGLATAEEIGGGEESSESLSEQRGWMDPDERVFVLTLAQKLHRLFQHDFPTVRDVRVFPVWIAGELLEFGGDFNKYITSKKLQNQEGMIFRHLLRLVLLIDELAQLCPPDTTVDEWQQDLGEIADQIEDICRNIDKQGTEQWLQLGKNEANSPKDAAGNTSSKSP